MKQLLLKLMPRGLKDGIKSFLTACSNGMYRFFSLNGFLASLYYLFNPSFYREHKAALKGKLAYQHLQHNIAYSSALLRRNTHRLEKGLIMQPRRPSFAEGYILETVEVFERVLAAEDFCQQELGWAFDVLNEYFAVVSDQGRIGKARKIFSGLTVPANVNKGSVPYAHQLLPELSVNTEQLHQLFHRRRSVRWYQQKPVEKALLEKAVQMASLAPSACNRQPFRFEYTTDPVVASRLAKYAMGTVGFAENLQALFVVVGDLSNYPSERDRHVIYIDGSLAAMQLMLSLETLGLSSCPINWPDVDEREKLMQKDLGLAFHERPIMLIAAGYAKADGGIPYSQKKGNDLLMKEING